MNTFQVKCKNLSKSFEIPVRGEFNSFSRSKDKEIFWALRDISFSVNRGETFGIIGSNGSGKSTLLKIISGITPPSEGQVEVEGRVSALLELGTGFHPELSGWENIFLYASILCISRDELKKSIPDIVEFSGISNFLDTPIKHYSSGMLARLAFSVAVNVNPEILLIDEILSVGDVEFQSRSLDKIKEFKANNKTIIIVTHEIAIARQLCDRMLWLEDGRIKDIGSPESVAKKYQAHYFTRALGQHPFYMPPETSEKPEPVKKDSAITVSAILPIRKTPESNLTPQPFKTGEKVTFEIKIKTTKKISRALISIIITKEPGIVVSEINSGDNDFYIEDFSGEQNVFLTLDPLLLTRGRYFLSIGLIEPGNMGNVLESNINAFAFDVETENFEYDFFMINHPARWNLNEP